MDRRVAFVAVRGLIFDPELFLAQDIVLFHSCNLLLSEQLSVTPTLSLACIWQKGGEPTAVACSLEKLSSEGCTHGLLRLLHLLLLLE